MNRIKSGFAYLGSMVLLLLLFSLMGCNKSTGDTAADANVDTNEEAAELNAVGDIGATRDDILIPADTEISIVVDYHGWDVDTGKDDPSQREHVFSVLATWGTNLHTELREIVAKEGESAEARLDIGEGQILSVKPKWNSHQRGSFLFQVEEADSGKVIAAFDARDTDEIESKTVPAKNGHHSKTVFADLDKRIYLHEVKVGSTGSYSRQSEFGLAYVGEGYADMPTCAENDDNHWHFPRFELTACPREWMANYSFKGLGQKLSSKKMGMEGTGGIITIDWEKAYSSRKRSRRNCFSGG